MKRKLQWGFTILITGLLAINAFLLLRTTDTETKTVYKPLTPAEEEQVQMQIHKSIQKAKPGYKMVKHGNHYHEVPIGQTAIFTDQEQRHEPMPVENLIVNSVNDLKEYFNYFESFSDDISLEEYEGFKEKHNQYYAAMQNFDYRNASPEQQKLARQIDEKITTVQTNVFAKKSAMQAQSTNANLQN